MNTEFQIELSSDDADLEAILALQKLNLPENLSPQQRRQEGFVSLRHDIALLRRMQACAPQIIIKKSNEVCAYALSLIPKLGFEFPDLNSMFASFDRIYYQNKALSQYSHYIMGQICIAHQYRGQGLFHLLYQAHLKYLSPDYQVCITEVASQNPRSLRAHQKQGFDIVHTYTEQEIEWNVLVWNWS